MGWDGMGWLRGRRGQGQQQHILAIDWWNLVCQHEWLQYLVLGVFFAGFFSGFPLCYVLCYNVGHRRTYFGMLFVYCAAGALQAVAADFKHFCLLRFMLGISIPTIQIVTTDLMVELSGVRVLSSVIIYNELMHLIGLLMLTSISYLIGDYRHLSLAISLPFVIFLFLWWSFPESANYLLTTSRINELERQVLEMAHTNLGFVSPEFEESLKRRIYIELAIYKEFLITSLMHDSFKKLDEYMHANYVDWNVMHAAAGGGENSEQQIDVDEHVVVNDDNVGSMPQQQQQQLNSSLVNKFSSHLNDKYYVDGQTMPEMWSESESDGETMAANHANGGTTRMKMLNGNHSISLSSSSETPTSSSTPPSVGNGKTTERHARFAGAASAGGMTRQSNSVCSILSSMPNMRRKLIVLVYLLLAHTTLVFLYNFIVIDFMSAEHARNLGHISEHSWFTFSITINIISLPLTALCTQTFGRKFTFFVSNLLATTFALLAAVFDSNVVVTSARSAIPFTAALGVRPSLNLPLVLYSLTKLCQSTCYLTLLIWTYELLPPVANCTRALYTCLTLANLPLLGLPILLYLMRRHVRVSVSLPEELLDRKTLMTQLNFPLHHLLAFVLLALATLASLVLPETGCQGERLPSSLQEAEMFVATTGGGAGGGGGGGGGGVGASGTNGSSEEATAGTSTTQRFYSPRVLFNFKPPNIWPNGILKKTSTTFTRKQQQPQSPPTTSADSMDQRKFKENRMYADTIQETSNIVIHQHASPGNNLPLKEVGPSSAGKMNGNFYATLPGKRKEKSQHDVSSMHLAMTAAGLQYLPYHQQVGSSTLAALDLMNMSAALSPQNWTTRLGNEKVQIFDIDDDGLAGAANSSFITTPTVAASSLSAALTSTIDEIDPDIGDYEPGGGDGIKSLALHDVTQGIMDVFDAV